jgi:hypothetical protein
VGQALSPDQYLLLITTSMAGGNACPTKFRIVKN